MDIDKALGSCPYLVIVSGQEEMWKGHWVTFIGFKVRDRGGLDSGRLKLAPRWDCPTHTGTELRAQVENQACVSVTLSPHLQLKPLACAVWKLDFGVQHHSLWSLL